MSWTRFASASNQSKIDVPLRIMGSTLVVIGWWSIVHTHTSVGVGLSLVGDCLAIPYFLRTRAWDVVVMIAALHSMTVYKLSQDVFTSAGF